MANKRLLVIDDNEDSRILVKFALEMNQKWQVATAKDGIEGITKAETERPDVILLDFIMPNLDGLSVYEVLKSNLFTCSIPIIFVTAMTQNKILTLLGLGKLLASWKFKPSFPFYAVSFFSNSII